MEINIESESYEKGDDSADFEVTKEDIDKINALVETIAKNSRGAIFVLYPDENAGKKDGKGKGCSIRGNTDPKHIAKALLISEFVDPTIMMSVICSKYPKIMMALLDNKDDILNKIEELGIDTD